MPLNRAARLVPYRPHQRPKHAPANPRNSTENWPKKGGWTPAKRGRFRAVSATHIRTGPHLILLSMARAEEAHCRNSGRR